MLPESRKPSLPTRLPTNAAGFLRNQAAGGEIPGFQVHFPEAVVTAAAHVAQVERGGTGAAQAGGGEHHVAEHAEVGIGEAEVGVGEAGADQALGEFVAHAGADAALVQVRAATARGGEEFVACGVVDHRLGDLAFVLERDRHGILLQAVEEIGGAVERIDDPLVVLVVLGFGDAMTPLLKSHGLDRRRAGFR